MFNTDERRQRQLESAPDVRSLFDKARQQMRSTGRFSEIALAAASVLKALPEAKREALGWERNDRDLDNAERALEKLAAGEEPAFIVFFDGDTPKSESRPFVRGSAAYGKIQGAILLLGGRPVGESDTVHYIAPSAGLRHWEVVDVPGALFRVPGLIPAPEREPSEDPLEADPEPEQEADKA